MGILSENSIVGASYKAPPEHYDYKIDNSLRFNKDDDAYLSWTPTSAGNKRTFTVSAWVKPTTKSNMTLLRAYSTDDNWSAIGDLTTSGDFWVSYNRLANTNTSRVRINNKLRDPSAWYHLVIAIDTTQGTAANRVKTYVNGVQVGLNYTDYPSQNFEYSFLNNTYEHRICYKVEVSNNEAGDGYLAEYNFIDGQALTASDFGEADEDYGDWKPKAYTGTYGTNGFYLDFKSSSSLGNDASSNSNNWTPNNLAATDQMVDTPTNNFCTLNPLDKTGTVTLSEGNLKYVSNTGSMRGTISSNNTKLYFEYCQVSTVGPGTPIIFGLGTTDGEVTHTNADQKQFIWVHCDNAATKKVRVSVSGSVLDRTYNALGTIAVGDIFQFAYDPSSGKTWVGLNNTWLDGSTGTTGNPSTGANPTYTFSNTSRPVTAYVDHAGVSHTGVLNFGQDSSFAGQKTAQGNQDSNSIGDFYYTPPTGFLALCSANLPNPTVIPSDHFNTVTYAGNSTDGRSITGVGFSPDLIWSKVRSIGYTGSIYDRVRGAGASKHLAISSTEAEGTSNWVYGHISSFDSDGYSLGVGTDAGNPYANENESGQTYVAWNWKGGGAAVSNTSGTITSSVSANVGAGFSIVGYVGNQTSGATVGHGLNSAPEMIILKNRSQLSNWMVYHSAIGNTKHLRLDTNAAEITSSTRWNNTSPTSSVFTIGNDSSVNGDVANQDLVAYCFHSVDGYSKCGSFVGNGSTDGPFVHTGFKPAWVLIKGYSPNGSWGPITNSKILGYNPDNNELYAGLSQGEVTSDSLDYLSNGFKMRRTSGEDNASGRSYIFLAFAEMPSRWARGR